MKNIITDKQKKKLIINMIYIIVFICVIFSKNVYATNEETLTNTTRAYFYSELTKNLGCGDCILLENYDENGQKHYGLIDAGVKTDQNTAPNSSVERFLNSHNVETLDFFMITHNHSDHNGEALNVLNNFTVEKIYMNVFDHKYVSDQNDQSVYENILTTAIDKQIPVIGVSYGALESNTISPGRSSTFKQKLQEKAQNIVVNNFQEFNETNTLFTFGSAQMQIFNWEVFDSDGNQLFVRQQGNEWVYNTSNGEEKTREVVSNDNNNSFGLLLTQGNRKAFFAGDLNNNDKKEATDNSPERVGDEDRIKDAIGDVDFMKLGHHGNAESNTKDYINVLKPEYAVISNDMGRADKEISDWMKNNNVNYLYTTQDKFEIAATISNDKIYLGLGTEKVINKINGEFYYVQEGAKYKDYKQDLYKVIYQEKNVDVNSWEQLKSVIYDNKNNQISIDNDNKTYTVYELIVSLIPGGDWNANSKIDIEPQQKVVLTSNENVTITRDINFKSEPLFLINGILSLGKQDMIGKITIDGNKNNVISNSPLINVQLGDLNLYSNVSLCNNFNEATGITKKSGTTEFYASFGSAIFAENGTINMYGGEIRDNCQNVLLEYELPEETSYYYNFSTMGAGIYMESASSLNMYGGSISNNEAKNESIVRTNKTYTNAKKNRGIKQQCFGVGVYACRSTEVNLINGEIKNNIATNESNLQVNTSTIDGKTTNVYTANNSIYGVGIYTDASNLKISNDFEISNNNAIQNSQITLQQNTKVKNTIASSIRGLNGYLENTSIDIKGGKISGGTATNNSNISNDGSIGSGGTVSILNLGGGLNITKCIDASIENLKINNCICDRGAGIYIGTANVRILNSEICQNQAIHGGGMFVAGATSSVDIINSKINNNKATTESGGGIYTYGALTIDGESTEISYNTAKKAGGAIRLNSSGSTIINGGTIANNSSEGTGGAIHVDGTLDINGGTITDNYAKTTGGGIYYSNGTLNKNGGTIKNNIAEQEGNNIYPVNENIIDETAPTGTVSYSTTESTNQNVTVTITANEEIQEVEGWTLSQDKKVLTKEYQENINENVVVKDIVGNETTANVNITNIDKTAPTATVIYSTQEKTKENVTVRIEANEEIQEVDGWTLSQDKKILTKEYQENINENVVVKDIVGNETTVDINIGNIVKSIGDLNGNNIIDIADILMLKRYIAYTNSTEVAQKHPNWILNDEQISIGDVNKTGNIDIGDVLKLQRYIAACNSEEVAQKHPTWLEL